MHPKFELLDEMFGVKVSDRQNSNEETYSTLLNNKNEKNKIEMIKDVRYQMLKKKCLSSHRGFFNVQLALSLQIDVESGYFTVNKGLKRLKKPL